MPITAHLGLDAKAYHGTAGTTADQEMENIREVTLNVERGEADASVRGGQGWRSTVPVLRDGTAEFVMLFDPADTAFQEIQAAFFQQNQPIALMFLHAENGDGLDADWHIFNFSRPEPLEDVLVVNVTAKVYTGERVPVWVEG